MPPERNNDHSHDIGYLYASQEAMSQKIESFYNLLEKHMEQEEKKMEKDEKRLKAMDRRIWITLAVTIAIAAKELGFDAVLKIIALVP